MTAAEPASLKVMGKATGTLSNGIGSNTVNEWLDWQEMAIAMTSLMLRDTGNGDRVLRVRILTPACRADSFSVLNDQGLMHCHKLLL